ncbi:MAG: Gfo/Idh/MocA family oxidoreductase [Kiritimatiellae bacterium]|nr:Gfo/Idh/MocA family oxidoreductase [Kiritimatiellia bacterium]
MNRRSFLKNAGIMGAISAFPSIVPSICVSGCRHAEAAIGMAKRKYGPNDLINVGVIGQGRIAITMDMPLLINYTGKARIVAVCDLDPIRRANGKSFVEKKYNEKLKVDDYRVDAYENFEELLARKDIDAVMICLPDHWHAIVAVSAIIAGKDVWLQKPFSQTIGEGRIIANLAKKYHTVMQVGSWQRSNTQFHDVCELVRNGRIGKIAKVEVGIGLDKAGGSSTPMPIPTGFNYDKWLGPTPSEADGAFYTETRVHTQNIKRVGDRPGWIQMAPYGWGMITNWGAHHLDIAQWGLGFEDSGPNCVSGSCEWMDTTGGKLWNVHTTYDLHYFYPGNIDLHVCNQYPMGVKFIGENGEWLYCMRGAVKVTPSDPDVPANGKMQPLMASKNKLLEPIANPTVKLKEPEVYDGKSARYNTSDHWGNWLDGIRRDDPDYTVTNAEHAHRSTSICSLGNMCMKTGKALNWDPKTERTGDADADKLLKPFERGPYSIANVLKANGLDIKKFA